MIKLVNCINKKLERINNGYKPRTLDLFAGAGGLSLGFHSAGFEIVAAVEIDKNAAATHESNFKNKVNKYEIFNDITRVNPDRLVDHCRTKNEDITDVIDLIIGGPPCQPFSSVGKAKLREVAGHPEAYIKDERVTLYTRLMAMVEKFQPLAFVMENVKEIGRFKGRNIPEEIAIQSKEMGYVVRYTLLNTAWYGVPQMRERMIIIGIHSSLGVTPTFPRKTHNVDLPQGYYTSTNGKRKSAVCNPYEHYIFEIPEVRYPEKSVTTREALSDLPPIKEHLKNSLSSGPRKFNKLMKYNGPPDTKYQEIMREWSGFENLKGIYDHVIRYTPRDYYIFRKMKHGDQYPEAHSIAKKEFRKKIKMEEKNLGRKIKEDEELYNKIKKETVPPYDPTKYPNKWRKLEPDLPSRTVTAHLGKDTYSHIHYDSEQARCISVREAARLQSFPDGFTFFGGMESAFKQIGNAVPPLMAYAIAKNLLSDVKNRCNQNSFYIAN